MSELCNAFTFWVQPKAQTIYSQGFSQIHIQTYSILHYEDVDKYIWQNGKQPNWQTINYSIWLALLLTASIFLPTLLLFWLTKIDQFPWISGSMPQIFVVGFCVLLFVLSVLRVRKEKKKERYRGSERLLLAPHLNELALKRHPAAVLHVNKYSNKQAGVRWTNGQHGGIFMKE